MLAFLQIEATINFVGSSDSVERIDNARSSKVA